MYLCCNCGGILWNQPLKITKWAFQGLTFLAPKWPSLSLVPFIGPKKSQAPRKVLILCTGTILNPWNGTFSDFQRVYFLRSHHIYSTGTLIILCQLFSTLFWGLFLVFGMITPPPPHTHTHTHTTHVGVICRRRGRGGAGIGYPGFTHVVGGRGGGRSVLFPAASLVRTQIEFTILPMTLGVSEKKNSKCPMRALEF